MLESWNSYDTMPATHINPHWKYACRNNPPPPEPQDDPDVGMTLRSNEILPLADRPKIEYWVLIKKGRHPDGINEITMQFKTKWYLYHKNMYQQQESDVSILMRKQKERR
jgi:hypothetical protein